MDAEAERMAWVTLAGAELPPRISVAMLLHGLDGPSALVAAPRRLLSARLGSARARAVEQALRRVRPRVLLRRAADAGQRLLTPADPSWPQAAFAGLDDPPVALWLRGALPPPDTACAAVVGTREASPYGLRAARELAAGLAAAGLWVVSGFAVGVDGAAHEAALESGGATLAVLGCGLDYAYPLAHAVLKEAVAGQGGLLCEHPPGTPPQKWHFPRRNRLVAAFARAVVVVEAAARSGALITARLALDQGREVLAVPGSIFSARQAGCHRLLSQGAALCRGAADVLEVLELDGAAGRAARPPPAGEPEGLLWSLLDDCEATDAGALCRRTGLDASAVAAALTALELEGRVQRLPGVGFLRLA